VNIFRFKHISILSVLLIIVGTSMIAQEIDDVSLAPKKPWYSSFKLKKPAGRIDEAIGVMNKGILNNLTMNYGQISDTRLEDPGNNPTKDFYNFRYPKTEPYGSMVDDYAILFAVEKNSKNGDNGNVIDGFSANGNEDWIAKDGSLGATHYDGSGKDEMLKYVDGTTPYLAHSDIPVTWPVDGTGEHFWPGYFRRDPETGSVYDGEFVSDRDVYGVYTDASNVQGDVLGIEIEQMAYCYGRSYAEDFQFYEFFIHNTSSSTIDSAWFGMYLDPDCSDYGQETLISPSGYGMTDQYPIIFNRDFDGDIGATNVPNNAGRLEDMDFGMIILETPNDLGVTDFHYYVDTGPTDDEELWPIISSNPNDPDIALSKSDYFHGSNPKLDDLSTITAPSDYVYIIGTGPFNIAPGDTIKWTIAVLVGDTDEDFIKNSEMAISMFEAGFVGPSAPPGPKLRAVPDDQSVTLYWDNSPELTPDPASGELDFEGYKIYRSEDGGVTWGEELKDYQGNIIGYIPMAQYDKDNSVKGTDPLTPANYLGGNTGLKYSFVDNTVLNGITYSYTVTSYDKGDPTNNISSYESAKGTGAAEKNFVDAIPAPSPIGYTQGETSEVEWVSGIGNGTISFDIIDPGQYIQYKSDNGFTVDPSFKIMFDGFPATSFSILDASTNTVLKEDMAINFGSISIIESIGLGIEIETTQEIGTIYSVEDETGKDLFFPASLDNTGSWGTTVTNVASSSPESRVQDYEIRFTDIGSWVYTLNQTQPLAMHWVPFEVWRVGPDELQIIGVSKDKDADGAFSVGDDIYVCDVPYPASTPAAGDSLKGFDPVGFFPGKWPMKLVYSLSGASGNLPVSGQKTTISYHSAYSDGSGFDTTSSYSLGDVLSFSMSDPIIDNSKEPEALADIKVVPNPYIVSSLFDPMENVSSVKFMYLPEVCDIQVFTMSGTKVKEINHTDGTGIENWNLTNTFGQQISYGVYYYLISTPGGDQTTGKLAIIR
jgi:hypothetical protein